MCMLEPYIEELLVLIKAKIDIFEVKGEHFWKELLFLGVGGVTVFLLSTTLDFGTIYNITL